MPSSLSIIGVGNMGEAIARGLLRGGTHQPADIIAAEPSAERRKFISESLGIRCVEFPADALAPVIVLAVKPQSMAVALAQLAPVVADDALIISIAAGITTATIEKGMAPKSVRVVRAMPNTPMLVGLGAAGIARGSRASAADLERAADLFRPSAIVVSVREDQLDAVTALSGSGPAYFFFLVEQMIAAGVKMGLNSEVARTLAVRTALGAANMMDSSGDSPETLRRKVTSPRGTTEAAITSMQAAHFESIVIEALLAAERRGRELSGPTP